MRTFCIFILIALSCLVNAETSLREKFVEVNESIFGGSVEFKCEDDIFKFQKNPLGTKLFWKKDLDWSELTELKVHETGISFTGFGIVGGLGVNNFSFKGLIPIYKYDRYLSRIPQENTYFEKVKKRTFFDMENTIDFYASTYKQVNLTDIKSYFKLNAEKYRKEQSPVKRSLGYPYDMPFNYFGNSELMVKEHRLKNNLKWQLLTKEEKAELSKQLEIVRKEIKDDEIKEKRAFEQARDKKIKEAEEERNKKLNSIEEAIKKYANPVEKIKPAYTYESVEYCRLVD